MPKDTGRDILGALINELTAIKRLPPKERILALVPLLDRSGGSNAESRLAAARSHAAKTASDAAGGQSALALELGVTPQRISTIISGKSSRRTKKSTAASQTGAAGG